MSYTYEYPRPAVTVDCVVFGLDLEEQNLKILLIQRKDDPFKDKWAIPGGFIHMDEKLEDAALRELEEETGMKKIFIEQLFTYGDPGRDPRGRVISVAYYALIKIGEQKLQADTDAKDVGWFSIHDIPGLAFDHDNILDMALERLKGKISYKPIGFELLPEKFTLTQIQQLYEIILEKKIDKRNFRKKILGMDFLEELNEIQKDVSHRAARLYRFNKEKYKSLEKAGFVFSI